jgi:hypothetical protein
MTLTNSDMVAERRTNNLIAYFNRRWKTASKIIRRINAAHRRVEEGYVLGREYSQEGDKLSAVFCAPAYYSPNQVSVSLSLFGLYEAWFIGGPSGSVKNIPPIKQILGSRRSSSQVRFSTEGNLTLKRRGHLLFDADFMVSAPDSTGEHRVAYLNHRITFGKDDQTFIHMFRKDLTELVLANEYPVTKAIDLAFRMYTFPPKTWVECNAISYPLERRQGA